MADSQHKVPTLNEGAEVGAMLLGASGSEATTGCEDFTMGVPHIREE
jgi:hypothetical protein